MKNFLRESDLAKELGISRQRIAGLRRKLLRARRDWKYKQEPGKKGRGVVIISDLGARTIEAHLGIIRITVEDEVRTIRQICINQRLVIDTTGKMILVPTNSVWNVGDRLTAIDDPNVAGRLVQTGNRPRWRGDDHYRKKFDFDHPKRK